MMVDVPDFNNYEYAIETYMQIENNGGWGTIPYYGLLKEGKSGEIILQVKERLAITGDFQGDVADPTFGEALKQAVIDFQSRHHISVDGVIGPQTTRTMNVSVSARIEQLEGAQTEWNKIDLSRDKQYVVNVPAFMAYAMVEAEVKHETKAIVGRFDRKTVTFENTVKYFEFNPYWNVPHSIASKDILPKMKKNPQYGVDFKYEFRRNGKLVNPLRVNWSLYSASNFPFTIRQLPNDNNALGDVKLMFPNIHNIYMHDTPAVSLFNRDRRMYSSGCIRLEDPDVFAHFALESEQRSLEWVREMMSDGINHRVYLEKANHVPVTIMYLLSWVDTDGKIHFSPDIYKKGSSYSPAVASEAVDDVLN